MQVRILKHCRIDGVPANPGEVLEVSEIRAKALIDNHFAEELIQVDPKDHPRRNEAIEFIKSRGYEQEAAEGIFRDSSVQVLADLDKRAE